jgi:hypothetical protein
VLYALLCVYFTLCALQLRDSFPILIQEKQLLQSTRLVNRSVFKAFLGMPFLFEMQALLDWTVMPTSLDLNQWLLFEVHALSRSLLLSFSLSLVARPHAPRFVLVVRTWRGKRLVAVARAAACSWFQILSLLCGLLLPTCCCIKYALCSVRGVCPSHRATAATHPSLHPPTPLHTLAQDIYATLYLTQCRQEERRYYPAGTRQPLDQKLLLGATLVTALLAVVLGPIVLFSSANPISSPNLVRAAHLEIGLRTAQALPGGLRAGARYTLVSTDRFSWAPLEGSNTVFSEEFDVRRCVHEGAECGYKYLRADWNADYQRIVFAPFSDDRWNLSPPARAQLLADLGNTHVRVWARVDVQFTRDQPATMRTVSAPSSELELPFASEIRNAMRELIGRDSPAAGAPRAAGGSVAEGISADEQTMLHIDGLAPKLVRLPSATTARPFWLGAEYAKWHTYQNLTLSRVLEHDGHGAWWLANQTGTDPTLAPYGASAGPDDGLQVIAVCDRIASTAGASFFTGGIVAFYIAVVLTIGRSLRTVFGGSGQRVVYEEMADTATVRELCDGVYLARAEGDLQREHQLFSEVVTLMRSPETLLQVTGTAERSPVKPKCD